MIPSENGDSGYGIFLRSANERMAAVVLPLHTFARLHVFIAVNIPARIKGVPTTDPQAD